MGHSLPRNPVAAHRSFTDGRIHSAERWLGLPSAVHDLLPQSSAHAAARGYPTGAIADLYLPQHPHE